MSFQEMMKSDLSGILTAEEFARDVVYTPADGDPVTIRAMVEVKPPETIGEDYGRAIHHTAEIVVLNDSALGIDAVSLANDRVSFEDDSGIARTARILRVVNSDAAGKTLLIGW